MSKRRAARGTYRSPGNLNIIPKFCQVCRTEIIPTLLERKHPSHYEGRKVCGMVCRDLRYALRNAEKHQASRHPTTLDIAWAAGIYEGEGYCDFAKTERVVIGQKSPQILYWLRDLFGGRVYLGKTRPNEQRLQINGILARGFLMTIYKFLSDRRKLQIRQTLGGEAAVV